MFGPNQLKNNYLIDWELQSKVVELQEYFFNFKTNFLKLEHVTSPTRVLSKIPQDLTDKLKKIDDEFERLLSSHNAHQYIPSVEDEQPAPGERLDSEASPMIGPEDLHINEVQPDIGMSPLQVADLLLGRSQAPAHSQQHVAIQEPEIKHSDSLFSLHISISKLSRLLKQILELVNNPELKKYKVYIEVRTGGIIQRTAQIMKLKYERIASTLNADEWDQLKLILTDLVFDSRVYLSMFSRETICNLVEIMPEHAIQELVKATIGLKEVENVEEYADDFSPAKTGYSVTLTIEASRPYKQCFYKLVKAYYRWMMKHTVDFVDQPEHLKDKFYLYATSILKFFDRMILFNRTEDPTMIQSEVIYFDFLFAMYTYCNASELLKNYSECGDNSPQINSQVNNFFVRMTAKENKMSPESIHKESSADLKVDFIFLMALLSSMKLATNRFFTTEYSAVMRQGFEGFVNDLVLFSKHDDGSFQESRDGSTNVQKDERLDFGEGYLNLIFNEKQLQREKHVQNFLAEAHANPKMQNKYYYMLYSLVVRVQTNILFNTDENLLNNKLRENHKLTSVGKFDLPWRPVEEKLIELVRNNLSPILSECFLSKRDNAKEGQVFLSSIKVVAHQLLTMIKKFELASYVLEDDNPAEVEKMVFLSKRLKEFKEVVTQFALDLKTLDQDKVRRIECDLEWIPGQYRINYQNLIEQIFQLFQTVCDHFKLDFDPEDYRRLSVHSDHGNLDMLSIQTKHSRKHNSEGSDSSECYYKAILAGRVEMEVDHRQLNVGLARSFIKIFNKMLLNQPQHKTRFRKINHNIEHMVTKNFDFLFEDDISELEEKLQRMKNEKEGYLHQRAELARLNKGSLELEQAILSLDYSITGLANRIKTTIMKRENTHEFLLVFETNYFYNPLYTKAIIIYEKLIDELPDLKGNIFNESYKNKGLINFEAKDASVFRGTYPYLHNLYTLALQYSHHLSTGVIYNIKWGISISRLFIVLSLLNNLTLDNYQGFKEMFAEVRFDDYQLAIYKEKYEEDLEGSQKEKNAEEIQAGSSQKVIEYEREALKILVEEAQTFEQKESFLVSICCRLERFLAHFEFHDRKKITSNFESTVVTTALPVLTIWLNFMDVTLLTEDSPLMRKASYYVYHKLYTRFLLKMLFIHEDITNVEVLYLKKSICALLFKLIKNPDILDNLLKYQCDIRSIYDYTIKITKVHISALVSSDPSNALFKWIKRQNDQRTLEMAQLSAQDQKMSSLMGDICSGIQHLTEKLTKSRFSYRKVEVKDTNGTKSGSRMVICNTNLFGGSNFSYIKDREHQKDLERFSDLSVEEIMDCYKRSDNRDLGFQFINSLVKMMGFIEYAAGLKLWSSKKENARVQFEVEQAKLPKQKLYELKIVYFLSKINKQIEVVGKDGKSVLISFRKYPEIYTLENLNPLELISDFKFEDFKRDVCKIIPELYVKTNIQYNIQQKMGKWYMFLKSDTTKKHPVILWFCSLILNFIIFTGYENYKYQDDTHALKNQSYVIAEAIMAFVIMVYSFLTTCFWLSARYYAIRSNKNLPNMSELNSAKKSDTSNLIELKGILNFITDNPYFSFIIDMIFTMDTFSFALHFVFAAIGYFVHQIAYLGGICMFAFFNQTTRNLLKAIASNWLDLFLTLVLIFIFAYIFSILTYYYYFDMFDPAWIGRNTPCITLYACYMNTINFGIRMGGGIGEVLRYMPESSERYGGFIIFELIFFFFINVLGLNMLFGIIIDSFGNLREREWDIENDLNNFCLVCCIEKTEFEAKGIDFYYHVTIQHNIEDYVAYMIRLLINSRHLMHDIDYEIFNKVLRFDNSWFPSGTTLFMPKSKQEMITEDDQFTEEMVLRLAKVNKKADDLREILSKFERKIGLARKSTLVNTSNYPPGTRSSLKISN